MENNYLSPVEIVLARDYAICRRYIAVRLDERAFLCKVWCVKDVAAQLWWHGARGSSHSSWFKTLLMVYKEVESMRKTIAF